MDVTVNSSVTTLSSSILLKTDTKYRISNHKLACTCREQYLEEEISISRPKLQQRTINPSLLKWHVIGAQRISEGSSSPLYTPDSRFCFSVTSDSLLNKAISKNESFDHEYESDVESLDMYPSKSTNDKSNSHTIPFAKNTELKVPLPLSLTTIFGKEVDCYIDIDIDIVGFDDMEFSTLEISDSE